MTTMLRIVPIVFFGLLLSCYFFDVNQFRETISSQTDFGLRIIIEYLTDLRFHIRPQEEIEGIQLNVCNEQPKLPEIHANFDLTQYEHQCPRHRYITRLIERSPLIIYIEQFLTQNEIQHLIDFAEPFFKPSRIFNENKTYSINENRTSSTALLDRNRSPVVKCLEQRFAQFQGDLDVDCIEPMQVVKYTSDQQYIPHYDWIGEADLIKNGGERVTTFFTYLQSNCSRGETEFVAIRFNKTLHERFCDILFCDENSTDSGIRFRPLVGNSIFWYNMDEYGRVDYLTLHAGRPPGGNGHKIGLNTWTRLDKFL